MKNEIFSQFDIKNIAGDGDENGNEPLDEVKKAIENCILKDADENTLTWEQFLKAQMDTLRKPLA